MKITFGFNIENGKVEISSDPVGQSTNSSHSDFYVYEWFIKATGEVFYVGKGRGNRYKEHHTRSIDAEKIRILYETDVKFIAVNLSEQQAIELETQEMTRILNETTDRLTNRITPFFTKRDNGYSRSANTPKFEFEKAPHFYACEIDEHYFNIKSRPFDPVDFTNLGSVYLIEKTISHDMLEIVYGGNYIKYYDDVVALLEINGHKILKSKYAKSITAWIYSDDDYVTNYNADQEHAIERVGRNVPAYHLIDVWRLLKQKYGDIKVSTYELDKFNPKHDRVPLEKIKNANNWDKGFNAGFKYWEQGEIKRKTGDCEGAIESYNIARYNGYMAPVLYDSYAMAYRKLKDYENEIAILDEAITRVHKSNLSYNPTVIISWKEQRKKAIQKLGNRSDID